MHRLTSTSTPAPGGGSGGVLTISGSTQVKNIACDDRSASRATATCSRATQPAHDHRPLRLDRGELGQQSGHRRLVDAVSVQGTSDRVTYHSGNPTVTKSGFANSVERG